MSVVRARPSLPRPWLVGLAAVVGFGVGLATVAWSLGAPPQSRLESRREDPERSSTDGAAAPAPTQAIAPPRATQAIAPSSERASSPDPVGPDVSSGREAPSTADGPADDAAAEGVRRDASDLVLERGRLAYLRCPGAEDRGGRCPRDPELEARVWTILSELPQCTRGTVPAGTGDVRLHLRSDGDNELRFRDWGEAPLPLETLRACLEPAVGDLRTQLAADPVVVSFRFRLRPR